MARNTFFEKARVAVGKKPAQTFGKHEPAVDGQHEIILTRQEAETIAKKGTIEEIAGVLTYAKVAESGQYRGAAMKMPLDLQDELVTSMAGRRKLEKLKGALVSGVVSIFYPPAFVAGSEAFHALERGEYGKAALASGAAVLTGLLSWSVCYFAYCATKPIGKICGNILKSGKIESGSAAKKLQELQRREFVLEVIREIREWFSLSRFMKAKPGAEGKIRVGPGPNTRISITDSPEQEMYEDLEEEKKRNTAG